jgi:hypothetical protein
MFGCLDKRYAIIYIVNILIMIGNNLISQEVRKF